MQHRSLLSDAALSRKHQWPGQPRPMGRVVSLEGDSSLGATYPSIHGQSHGDGLKRVGAKPDFMDEGVATGPELLR